MASCTLFKEVIAVLYLKEFSANIIAHATSLTTSLQQDDYFRDDIIDLEHTNNNNDNIK